jgi:hypothetical protein
MVGFFFKKKKNTNVARNATLVTIKKYIYIYTLMAVLKKKNY